MIMVFPHVFTGRSKSKEQISNASIFPGGLGSTHVITNAIIRAFSLSRMQRSRTVNGDDYLPRINPSSVSNGISSSEHERLDGIVTIDISPNRLGQVKFAGGWWSAKCGRSITLTRGTLVKVVGRENIILVVEPMGAQPHFQEVWT